MSSDRSAIKWVLGCGVLFVVGVVVCGGLVFWLVRRAGKSIGEYFEEEKQRAKFAAEWVPPPEDAGPESLFPETVSGFTLAGQDEQSHIDEFHMDLDGRHARYESAQGTVEVFVYRANKLEKEAVFGRVKEAVEDVDYAMRKQLSRDLGNYARYDYTISPTYQQGIFWWASDWLFLFRTGDKLDLDPFVEAYLTAIQPDGEEPKGDPPADESARTEQDGGPPYVS